MYRLFLALHYLLSRPIHLLGMGGVMLGVWALILVVSIFSGFLREVRAHVQSATSDLTVFRLRWPTTYRGLEQRLAEDANVAATAPRLVWYGLLHPVERPGGAPAPQEDLPTRADARFVSLIGIDPASERPVSGIERWLEDVTEPRLRVAQPADPLPRHAELPGILLSRTRMQRENLVAGARVRLTLARMNAVNGEQQLHFLDREFQVAGAFTTKHVGFDESNAFVPIDTLRAMLAEGEGAVVNEVAVRLVDPADARATVERVRRALLRDHPGVMVLTWEQRNEIYLQAIGHQGSIMKLILFVIMVVATFLVFATLSMMVVEKTRDIGILTAMGATPAGVLQVFLTCGLAVTTVGTVLGILAGCLSAFYLDAFRSWMKAAFGIDLFPTSVYHLERVPYDLDPLWIAQVVGASLVLGLLAAGIPAWRAARHDPLRSLRYE